MTKVLLTALAVVAVQPPDRGVTWVTVLDNDSVFVTRVRMPPGTSGNMSPSSGPHVIVQLTPGDIEQTQIDANHRGPREAGAVTWLPDGVGNRFVNIGKNTFDLLTIRIKSTRPPAASAPATAAPQGITRKTLFDNAEVRVVRVQFEPHSREPVHTHPNDLLTVQVTGGKVEMVAGAHPTTAVREAGFVQFFPRDVSHAYANADQKPFELLSVSIK